MSMECIQSAACYLSFARARLVLPANPDVNKKEEVLPANQNVNKLPPITTTKAFRLIYVNGVHSNVNKFGLLGRESELFKFGEKKNSFLLVNRWFNISQIDVHGVSFKIHNDSPKEHDRVCWLHACMVEQRFWWGGSKMSSLTVIMDPWSLSSSSKLSPGIFHLISMSLLTS